MTYFGLLLTILGYSSFFFDFFAFPTATSPLNHNLFIKLVMKLTSLVLSLAVSQAIVSSSERKSFGQLLDNTFQSYQLDDVYNIVASPLMPSSAPSLAQAESLAVLYLENTLGLPKEQFVIKNSYTTDHNQVTHIYLQQKINDIFVSNGKTKNTVDVFN